MQNRVEMFIQTHEYSPHVDGVVTVGLGYFTFAVSVNSTSQYLFHVDLARYLSYDYMSDYE